MSKKKKKNTESALSDILWDWENNFKSNNYYFLKVYSESVVLLLPLAQILIRTLKSRSHYSNFTDAETEAHRDEVTCSGSLNLNAGVLDAKACGSIKSLQKGKTSHNKDMEVSHKSKSCRAAGIRKKHLSVTLAVLSFHQSTQLLSEFFSLPLQNHLLLSLIPIVDTDGHDNVTKCISFKLIHLKRECLKK